MADEDRDGEQPTDEQPEAGSALPPRVESWRKRSATGAMLTGIAFGLREVLEPERHEPAIVQETSGAPPEDLSVEADLADAAPRRSVVKLRPWLIDEQRPEAAAPDGQADADGPPEPTPTPARRSPGRWSRLRRAGTDKGKR